MVPRNALLFSSFSRLKPAPPRGGTPTSDTPRLVYLPENLFLMLARERARSACGGCRPSPTARLQRKSTVCGLSGFLPSAKADGSLQLNPQPRSALLLLRLFAPCSNGNSRFRFGKKNCASSSLFLSKTESKRFLERRERTKANGPTETVTAI